MLAANSVEYYARLNFFIHQKLDLQNTVVKLFNKELEITIENGLKNFWKPKKMQKKVTIKNPHFRVIWVTKYVLQ